MAEFDRAGACVLLEELYHVRGFAEPEHVGDFFNRHIPLRQQSPGLKNNLLFDEFFSRLVQNPTGQLIEFLRRDSQLMSVILHTP